MRNIGLRGPQVRHLVPFAVIGLLSGCTAVSDGNVYSALQPTAQTDAASGSDADLAAGNIEQTSDESDAEALDGTDAASNTQLAFADPSNPSNPSPGSVEELAVTADASSGSDASAQAALASATSQPVGGATGSSASHAANTQSTSSIPRVEAQEGFRSNLFASKDTGRPVPPLALASAQPLKVSAPAPGGAATLAARKRIDITTRDPEAGALVDTASEPDLPGVRPNSSLFEIKRRDGLADVSDVDRDEMEGRVQVASLSGLSRLAPNGLITQHSNVDVKCLKPALVRVLRNVESKFGKKVVVTSGYRSPSYNAKVNGAKKSLHMYCAAADIQVAGVSKWDLAKYLRTMPGRGGVGTYCHTKSVHIDVGPERDWNWRCR